MKILIVLITLILTGAAGAQTFDATLDRVQAGNLAQRDELIATRAKLQQVELKATAAIEANIQQNAAFKGQIKAKDAVITKQAKVLGKWYLRAVLFVAEFVFWFSIGAGLCYVLAFVGGICRPGTALFELSGKLISFLPWANVVEAGISLFHKTTTVRAAVLPIVEAPAVATRSTNDAEVVANLAALAARNTKATTKAAVDWTSNVGWPFIGTKAGAV